MLCLVPYSYGTMCISLDESSLSERAVLTSGTGCRKTIQVESGRPCAEIQTPTLWSWDLSSTAAPAPIEFHLPPRWWDPYQSSPTLGLLRRIYALELELPPLILWSGVKLSFASEPNWFFLLPRGAQGQKDTQQKQSSEDHTQHKYVCHCALMVVL